MKKKRIIRNAFRCLACDTVVESKSHHHFATCRCDPPNFTDGGKSYVRRGGKFDAMIDLTIEEEYDAEQGK